jgi:hypothetical protein
VLRKSPKGIKKAYITVPSKDKVKGEVTMLRKLVDFMKRENFSTYLGV